MKNATTTTNHISQVTNEIIQLEKLATTHIPVFQTYLILNKSQRNIQPTFQVNSCHKPAKNVSSIDHIQQLKRKSSMYCLAYNQSLRTDTFKVQNTPKRIHTYVMVSRHSRADISTPPFALKPQYKFSCIRLLLCYCTYTILLQVSVNSARHKSIVQGTIQRISFQRHS